MNRRDALAALALTLAAPFGMARAQDTATAATAPVIPEMSVGSPDAKVTITEYASYTCPHCQHFHETVFKSLKTDYIDTGKVRFIFREVYFDKFGLWAAMLARCGGEMRYFGISDILYDTQKDWLGAGDPAEVIANLKKIGLTAGMDNATMEACFNDQDKAKALIAEYQKNATEDGVEGTPTLFINGTKYSNMTYADLKAIIDPLLAE
jgi:protein-disulfide isomerase